MMARVASNLVMVALLGSSIVVCDETKALLQLTVNHAVKPEVRTNDRINFTCEVGQKDSSLLHAVGMPVIKYF